MPSMDRLSSYKTTVTFANGKMRVTYINTVIVAWDDTHVTLRSDGYETVTTKRKMNQTSNQFGLGFRVIQKNFSWFVQLPNGDTVPFTDGMTFERVRVRTCSERS